MSRAELLALAERVEAFDSDVRNGEALGAEVVNAATDGGLPFWEHANPLYSLDAALGLVPQGWYLHFLQDAGRDNPPAKRWAVSLRTEAILPEQLTWCATPALALTAAALRARAEGVA